MKQAHSFYSSLTIVGTLFSQKTKKGKASCYGDIYDAKNDMFGPK